MSLLLLNGLLSVSPAQDEKPSLRFEIPATDDGLPGVGPIRRNKDFQKTWSNRRTHFAEQQAEPAKSWVFLGDSITQGWGDDFKGQFPEVTFLNRGIGGDTTRGMLLRLQEDVLALQPRGVVMLMGTNDIAEKATPAMIADNVKEIIATIEKGVPNSPIILCAIFPSSEKKTRPAAIIKDTNKLCAEAVKGDPRVVVLDTFALFADASGDAKSEEFPDLLHPNAIGYAKWAAALRPLFATYEVLETADDSFAPEPGFESLFNGKDLTGWGFRPTAKEGGGEPTYFDGQLASPDGRYVAKHGRIVVTTPPEGRRVQQMWTRREFGKDFVLKLEFRATPNADSGVFLRQPQLQCRDYLLAGPYKKLKDYKPQEWNELEITVTGETARCTCNGEVLEEAYKLPPTGPIGLEGDRGQMEYRRIRIRETAAQ
jgi:lysophospholipase L1-like esterase